MRPRIDRCRDRLLLRLRKPGGHLHRIPTCASSGTQQSRKTTSKTLAGMSNAAYTYEHKMKRHVGQAETWLPWLHGRLRRAKAVLAHRMQECRRKSLQEPISMLSSRHHSNESSWVSDVSFSSTMLCPKPWSLQDVPNQRNTKAIASHPRQERHSSVVPMT